MPDSISSQSSSSGVLCGGILSRDVGAIFMIFTLFTLDLSGLRIINFSTRVPMGLSGNDTVISVFSDGESVNGGKPLVGLSFSFSVGTLCDGGIIEILLRVMRVGFSMISGHCSPSTVDVSTMGVEVGLLVSLVERVPVFCSCVVGA